MIKEEENIEKLMKLGNQAFSSQDFSKAIDLYYEILTDMERKNYDGIENYPEILQKISLCSVYLGDSDNATKCFTELLEILLDIDDYDSLFIAFMNIINALKNIKSYISLIYLYKIIIPIMFIKNRSEMGDNITNKLEEIFENIPENQFPENQLKSKILNTNNNKDLNRISSVNEKFEIIRGLESFLKKIFALIPLEARCTIIGYNDNPEYELPPMTKSTLIFPFSNTHLCFDITKTLDVKISPESIYDEESYMDELDLEYCLMEYLSNYSFLVFQIHSRSSNLHHISGYPYRKIWFYVLRSENSQLSVSEIPASEVYQSMTIKSDDRSRLPPGREEIYCCAGEPPIYGKDDKDAISAPFGARYYLIGDN